MSELYPSSFGPPLHSGSSLQHLIVQILPKIS